MPPRGDARPLPSRRQQYRPHSYAGRMDDAGGGGRFAGVLLAFAIALLIVTQALWQITAPGPAGRVLRSVLPSLTDLDQTLTANVETVREVAAGLPSDGTLVVPGLPVAVELTRDEALTADPPTLRRLTLARMSDRLYQDGAAAFRSPDAAAREPGLLSSQWTLQGTLNALTADRHEAFRVPRLGAAVLALLLAVLTIWLQEGPARLISPGVSVVVGGLLATIGAMGAWLVGYLFFSGGDVVDGIVRQVVRDGALTVAATAAIFAVFGCVVTGVGLFVRRMDRAEPPAPSRGPRPAADLGWE